MLFFLKPRYRNQFGGYWSEEDGASEKYDVKEHVRDIVRRALHEKKGIPQVVKATRQVGGGDGAILALRFEYHDVVEAARYLETLKTSIKEKKIALEALAKKQAEIEYELLKIQSSEDEFLLLCLLQ